MPKFDIWVKTYSESVVTVTADSIEQASDMVHENPEADYEDRSWLYGGVEILHWQELPDEG